MLLICQLSIDLKNNLKTNFSIRIQKTIITSNTTRCTLSPRILFYVQNQKEENCFTSRTRKLFTFPFYHEL